MRKADAWDKIRRSLRYTKVNRELLVFFVFLLVAVVFWFIQTFKDAAATNVEYELVITDVPKNVVITSDVPKTVVVNVGGRGFDIINFLTKARKRSLEIDYSSLAKDNGMFIIDNNVWKRIVPRVLGSSLSLNSVTPSTIEVFYSTGEHKYVPVVFSGKVNVDTQHVLCGISVHPEYVDIYAPSSRLDTITAIYTEARKFVALKDTTSARLALSPPKGVKCIPDSVDTRINVDLFTTKTLNLPIYCENIPEDKILRTFPLTASVSFRVSATLYNEIEEGDFALVVDYRSIKPGDKKCELIMRSHPDGISNIHISPSSVEYIIEQE